MAITIHDVARAAGVGIVPFFTRFFFVEVLRGMEATLAQLSSDLVLYNVETNAQRDRYLSQLPIQHKVNGFVILSLTPDDAFACRFAEKGMPVVLVDAYSSYPYCSQLFSDRERGRCETFRCSFNRGDTDRSDLGRETGIAR
ncbi:MAG TPA: hypothetical protein DDW33_13075 [Ktedonobacter sp.]|jgi:DNA-binding LacI/PurR family transcriptional regulator|nr:hypothetical protein [Ktedonobacter sp.]HAH00897.1 hypothetical protein [Ktedonobacter sp.]HBE26607.1 hypothetical protein [Ktedonobacter sp.]HCF85196.1 hypothetical protein [Ktedonobacter sp.]